MSQCEILPFIQLGLNYIMDKNDIDKLVELYKLSILIKNSDDDNYKLLFAMKYLDYYYTRIEFINGVKKMSDRFIEEIKTIIINSIDAHFNKQKQEKSNFINKYYERREFFLNLSTETIRKSIIDEQLDGVHSSIKNIENLEIITNSISYNEQKKLKEINIDFELSKVLGRIKNRYTEDGNYEDDYEVINIIDNNLHKRGYTSHHLHIHVYDELDKAIYKIFNTYNKIYQKIS